MKKYIYILFWLLSPFCMQAQTTIVQAEYWFDGDYSTSTLRAVGPATNLFHLESLDVSGLNNGLHTVTYRFRDSRGVWGTPLVKFFTYDKSSVPGIHSVVAFEYWFDGDYSTAQTGSAAGINFNLNENVDVAGLVNGLHTITYRFKDSRGMWGAPLVKFFTKEEGSLGIHEIVKYEYWFNDDYAGAVKQSVTSTVNLNIDEMVDVSGLPEGVHTVNYRFQDDAGKWSPPASWMFHNVPAQSGSELHEVIALEYWFDGDRSTTQKSAVSATGTFQLETMLDVSGLHYGFHYISYRFQDEAGNWSPAVSKMFAHYPDAGNPVLQKIVECEYWFDGDRSSTQKSAVSATGTFQLESSLDVSGLDYGLHYLNYRFRDEAGNWSPAVSKMFAHYPATESPGLHEIVEYQYWFDGDMSAPVSVPVSNEPVLSIDESLDISALGEGLHIITHRFKDKSGRWSPAVSSFFSYIENETLTTDNKIVGYRYWADNDIASATEVLLETPVKSLVLDELIDVGNFPSGEHMASFQFVDAEGQWSGAVSQNYSKAVQPFVEISADDSTVCLGTTISFSADVRDADVIEWKFGDGETSTGFTPEHTYAAAGVYEVTAVVTHTDSAKSAFDTIVGGIEVYPVYDDTMDVEVCASNLPFTFGTQSLVASGTYTETFTSIHGCDSVVTLNLSVVPVLTTNLDVGICLGESYPFGGNMLNVSGTYKDTLLSAGGCDSVVVLDLAVHPTYETPLVASICQGESYNFGGEALNTTGIYRDTLSTVHGCDSVLVLDLTVNPVFVTLLDKSVCEGTAYRFGGEDLTEPGSYRDTLQTVDFCDSVIVLDLTVHPVDTTFIDSTICQGESVDFNGQSLTVEDVYVDTLQSVNSCDSFVVLNLIVNPVYDVKDTVAICEGDTYLFGGTERTLGGDYIHTFTSVSGCDSTVTLTLNVIPVPVQNISAGICQGGSYDFGGEALTLAGEYKDTLTASSGCDSIVVLTLNVHPVYETLQTDEVCEGDSISFAGYSVGTTGIYRDTLASVNGCDSVLVLDLTVHPVYETRLEASICRGETYPFAGELLAAGGIYKDTMQSVSMCDSVLVLELTVNDTFNVNETLTLCENELPFQFGTQSLTVAGDYTETFSSASGCDSTVNLTLNVLDSFVASAELTLCSNELPFRFGTQNLTAGGVYTEVFTASSGCDSTVTLTLNVNPAYDIDRVVAIDNDEFPYTFGTRQLTEPGIYRDSLLSVNGCDSVITLFLNKTDDVPPAVKCNDIEVWLPVSGRHVLTGTEIRRIASGTKDNVSAFGDMDIAVSPSTFTCADYGEVRVTLRVTDEAGNEATCKAVVQVKKENRKPTLDPIADITVNEDSVVSIPLSGISGGDDCVPQTVTISATGLNPDLVANLNPVHETKSTTAQLQVGLVADAFGTDEITVTVTDSEGGQTSRNFTLTVQPVNDAPVLVQPLVDQSLTAAETLTFSLSKLLGVLFDDVDDSTLTYSVRFEEGMLPDWITATDNEDVFTLNFEPLQADTGCYNIVVSAADTAGATASDTFELCVDKLLVGISDLTEGNFEVSLFPNPTRGEVKVETSAATGEMEIAVMNIAGAEVFRKTYRPGNEPVVFDLSGHVSGMYMVLIRVEDKLAIKKLVLDRQ